MDKNQYSSFYELYTKTSRPVITAHGTYIGHHPENSIQGIQASVDAGCDFVEFDVRTCKDGVPVLIHDTSPERTALVTGTIKEFTLAELEKMNFSHYEYFVDCSGRTLDHPLEKLCPIARLETVFARFASQIFLNIQIYEQDLLGLQTICGMFKEFDLYERGYFTMLNFKEAEKIRAIDPNIELCVLNRPTDTSRTTIAMLHDFHDFGTRFAQPRWYDITPEYCQESHKLGIFSNVYYANYIRDAKHFIECGIDGILTDYPDVIIPFVKQD
ncbi:MAG: glycerophosphodiester phosphodiesterase family protein [Lentisphaeria bacterium]